VPVAQEAVDRAGQDGAWSHLRFHPADGSIVVAGSRSYEIRAGAPYMLASPRSGTAIDPEAITRAGQPGAWAHLAAPKPPVTVPGGPSGVVGRSGDRSVLVSWSAPASTGGSPITGYRVTASPGGKTCTTTGARSCRVSGLVNGRAYRFTVRAANSSGWGPASAASKAVTPTPQVRVTVRAVSGADKLFVDVDPNKGSGYWSFRVHKRTRTGSWSTLPTTYRTQGSTETRTVNLPKGTYRVVVAGKYGHRGATSKAITLTR
jgi:serine protease